MLFRSKLKRFRSVGDIRGKGLLAGIEFVQDRQTKQPFPRAERFAERLTDAAFRNGLIVWPNIGHVDGTNGDILMLAPPFIITEEQIEEMIGLLEQSLEEVP